MRLQQYLTEVSAYPTATQIKKNVEDLLPPMNQDNFDLAAFLKLWASIKKDCKPAIEYVKASNAYIYRGMKNVGYLGDKTPRSDRKPKDTSTLIHDMIDEVMEDHYGWKPRSEGLFCTGDPYGADSYGQRCIIFPVGKFEYIWSPHVRDSYSQFGDGEMMEKFVLKDTKSESMSQLYQSIYGPKGTLAHMGSWEVYGMGLESLGDITSKEASTRDEATILAKKKFKGKQIGLVEWSPELQQHQWMQKIREEGFNGIKPTPEMYKEVIEDLLDKTFKYQEAGIVNAIQSGNEIIVKTPKYYYLRSDMYGKALNYVLGIKR